MDKDKTNASILDLTSPTLEPVVRWMYLIDFKRGHPGSWNMFLQAPYIHHEWQMQ